VTNEKGHEGGVGAATLKSNGAKKFHERMAWRGHLPLGERRPKKVRTIGTQLNIGRSPVKTTRIQAPAAVFQERKKRGKCNIGAIFRWWGAKKLNVHQNRERKVEAEEGSRHGWGGNGCWEKTTRGNKERTKKKVEKRVDAGVGEILQEKKTKKGRMHVVRREK